MTALDQLQLVKLQDITRSEVLVTIAPDATVAEALRKMKQARITCLPVIRGSDELLGILDVRNVVFFLAWGKYKISGDSSASVAFDDKVDYGAKHVGDLLSAGNTDGGRVWLFNGSDPVQSVIEPFSKGVHRAIVKVGKELRLLTQTDVARWIATNSAFGKILDRTIKDLGLYNPGAALITAKDTDSALEAFRKAATNEVSAVAIVDSKNGRLVANLSGTDLRGVDAVAVRSVEKPVTAFLAEQHSASLNPIVVHRDDTLRYTLFKLLSLRVHRVWAIDVEHKPQAVITLGDVIGKFSPFSKELQE